MSGFLGGGVSVRGVINWAIVVVLAVALIRSCYANLEYERRLNELTSVEADPETPAIQEAEEISRQVDTAGRERVVYRMAEPIIQKIEDHSRLDSLLQVANVARRRVRAADLIAAELKTENLELKRVVREGLKDTVYQYRDKWLINTIFRGDSSLMSNIWIDASVNRVEHDHRRLWLFGRNEVRSTIWYNSPYIRQSGYEALRIRRKEPLVGFNIFMQGKYMPKQQEFLVGPSIRLGIGRVGVRLGYYYNSSGSSSSWVGADYRVY